MLTTGRNLIAAFVVLVCASAAFCSPRPAGTEWTNSIGMSFHWCPPGEFLRERSAGQDRVTLTRGFWMGTYPVTQGEWKRVMGQNPSEFKDLPNSDRRPVNRVSWENVQKFIERLGELDSPNRYRLPTEAEWEYACRAGTTGARYGRLSAIAWSWGNSNRTIQPVGEKLPNDWGLYDMLGNVWEWCHDWYGEYPTGPDTNPTGPSQGQERVVRGGSWRDDGGLCRADSRFRYAPILRFNDLGFRIVRE